MPKKLFFVTILFMCLECFQKNIFACDSGLCTLLGRRDTVANDAKELKRIFFDFMFEQQNWDEIPIDDAHELHRQGHHVHDKTHEEFYHFQAGVNPHPPQ